MSADERLALDVLAEVAQDENGSRPIRSEAADAVLEHLRSAAWRRIAWALLVVVSLLGIVWALGCAGSLAARVPLAPSSVDEQAARAVKILGACITADEGKLQFIPRAWEGSGTIVGRHAVLTASHVAYCDGQRLLLVTDASGEAHRATLLRADPEHDLAVLQVADTLGFDPPAIATARPHGGDVACVEHAVPDRGRSCGPISADIGPWTLEGLPGPVSISLKLEFVVEPGNSGSGVWDASGRLICVATHGHQVELMGVAIPIPPGYCSTLAGRGMVP